MSAQRSGGRAAWGEKVQVSEIGPAEERSSVAGVVGRGAIQFCVGRFPLSSKGAASSEYWYERLRLFDTNKEVAVRPVPVMPRTSVSSLASKLTASRLGSPKRVGNASASCCACDLSARTAMQGTSDVPELFTRNNLGSD